MRADRHVDRQREERAEQADEPETVTCLRCGAVYEAGAVVCFKCGAPIGEISTPTQPINRRMAQPPPPEPPSAPTPEKTPRKQAKRVKQPKTPKTPLPPEVVLSRRGRRLRVALFFTLAVTLLGVGVWGARALLAGPPVPRQVVYQDPSHRFRLSRPGLWSATPGADGVLLADSSGASSLRVTLRALDSTETAQTAADRIARERALETAAPVAFANVAWERRVGQLTGRDGAVRQVTVDVAVHGAYLYVIELSSPLATYASVDTLVFQPALASFQFA